MPSTARDTYTQVERYENLIHSGKDRSYAENLQRRNFYLWTNLALVDCPHCFESITVAGALVHLRLAHKEEAPDA